MSMPDDLNALPRYDEVPSGLIPVSEAARKYGRPRSTLNNWLRSGQLQRVGRLRRTHGPGGIVLIDESELIEILSSRNILMGVGIYDEVPPGLLSIAEASRKYGRSRSTLDRWVRKGFLPARGRLKGTGIRVVALVCEAELTAALRARPSRQSLQGRLL